MEKATYSKKRCVYILSKVGYLLPKEFISSWITILSLCCMESDSLWITACQDIEAVCKVVLFFSLFFFSSKFKTYVSYIQF